MIGQRHTEEQFSLNNLLFVVEDYADTYAELEAKLTNPEVLIFDQICDEIFGDG